MGFYLYFLNFPKLLFPSFPALYSLLYSKRGCGSGTEEKEGEERPGAIKKDLAFYFNCLTYLGLGVHVGSRGPRRTERGWEGIGGGVSNLGSQVVGGAARADEQDSAFFVLSTESKTMDGDDAWKEMNE